MTETRRIAVITGGSGGIGLACAASLRQRGYDVVLTSRTEATLRAAADQVGARWVVADSADPKQFAVVVDSVERIDLLVHSAGMLGGTFVRKERIEDFDEVIRTNLRSAFVATQAALPKMGVGGRIVFISSSSSQAGQKGRSAYSASKAGMNAFAQALTAEVARDGINVNVLVPAPVQTEMLEEVSFDMHAIQSTDVAEALVFLDTLNPRVVVGEIAMRAAAEGPLSVGTLIPGKVRST